MFGAVWEQDVALSRMTDYQTAQLGKNDRAWTTRGVPAGRAGGAATYAGAHQRWRDYHADLRLAVVLRLNPADANPTIDALAAALDRPARDPLYRAQVLPALCADFRGLGNGRAECLRGPACGCASGSERAPRVLARNRGGGWRLPHDHRDGRNANWVSGLHGGGRRICEGSLASSRDEA